MPLNSNHNILRSYHEGHIGWREACRRLNIETFSELEVLMKAQGLTLYQPNPEESASRMDELDHLLYSKDEM